jgi:hypothetical protein
MRLLLVVVKTDLRSTDAQFNHQSVTMTLLFHHVYCIGNSTSETNKN